jgi:hypothetical protein
VFEPLYATQDWTDIPFDCIALFYAVLAVGVLYADVETPKKTATKYNQLACSALAMARFEDVPTLRCIQTLVGRILRYSILPNLSFQVVLAWQISAAESNLAQNRGWAQIGMAIRLAQSVRVAASRFPITHPSSDWTTARWETLGVRRESSSISKKALLRTPLLRLCHVLVVWPTSCCVPIVSLLNILSSALIRGSHFDCQLPDSEEDCM